MVRGAGLFQNGIAVELSVRGGVIAAVKGLLVGFRRAVVGECMAGYLPPGQSAPVGECGQVDRVNRSTLLEQVEHLFRPLVHKRNGPHLDPDRLSGQCLLRSAGCGQ